MASGNIWSNDKSRNKHCKGCWHLGADGYCGYILSMKQRRPAKVRPGGGCECYTTRKPVAQKNGRPLVILTREQKTSLRRLSKTPNTKQSMLDDVPEALELWRGGALDTEIALSLHVSKSTVCHWRHAHGLATNYKSWRVNDDVD